MSDGFKRTSKPFQPYNPSRQDPQSVDVSMDPFRYYRPAIKVQTSFEKIMQHQSTDQPCSPNLIQMHSSYDGQEMCYIMNDNNLWFSRPPDGLISQTKLSNNIPLLFVSPRVSQAPIVQQSQQKQVQSSSEQQHFQKEQLKFFKEDSAESEAVINYEESSFEQKPKRKTNLKGRKHKHTSDSSESYRVSRKKKTSKINDTKNITKNYSKAIISYIFNNPELVQSLIPKHRYEDLVNFLKNKKNSMTNIKQLRDLWVDGGKNAEFNRVFRIISQLFLKTQAVSYVYNSRISNTAWHLKYRYNLLRALKEPENFKFIKDI